MKRHWSWLLASGGAILLLNGCASMFSSTHSATETKWKSYAQVELAFSLIEPGRTTAGQLKQMGFDPTSLPNIKVLTYVDVMVLFMPNPSITPAQLPPAVRECIDAKEHGHAYAVELSDIRTKRHGNVFLDMFGFKRNTHESGWRFRGLILLKDDLVLYKLSSGEPSVSKEEQRKKPLGPLQELDTVFGGAVGIIK
ncbi:MAG: YceK/YidQ family lipoprotein [Verrucomicrobia bacterium]|nr:MAG: YceK/YidQ family lipoprotein [Verrucomicrobiota bacterium]